MADSISIKLDNVNKTFKLPHEKQSSIKGLFVNAFKRKRTFEKQQVLKDISFEVNKGEFFGIVGRNGSGKSTLLKLLAGIYTPDSGMIQVNGKLTPFIELGVGFNQELTGRENVFLNGALLGFNRKEMLAMYDEIVEFAELENFMDQKLKNYSSGMQVRLAFSIAIRAKSDILLVDEVLAVGDVVFQRKCYKFFESIKQSGQTVVFISHDSTAVERFCDRVALIDQGVCVDVGSPRSVLTRYLNIVNKDRQITENQIKDRQKDEGQVTVDEVSVVNSSSKGVTSVGFGEKFNIEIKYHTRQAIPDAIVGLAISDEKNRSVLGPNTKEINKLMLLKKKGKIVAEFPSLPLSPGEYTVTVGFFNNDETYSYALEEHATSLTITGKQRHGIIDIQPKWKGE